MSLFSSAKAKLAASKLAEEQLYAQAAEEVASGQIRQGLWAKAIAETGGDGYRPDTLGQGLKTSCHMSTVHYSGYRCDAENQE